MLTVQEKDFASDIEKYFDMAKINPLTIERRSGERYTITFDFLNAEEEFAAPLTPEEEAAIAIAEAEHARGEYYVMRDDETAEEFFNRISSDPEKWLACNTGEWPEK